VAVDHFERLRRQLAEIAEAGGYDRPDALAGQLLVVIYGLYSAGAVLGPDSTVASAVTLSDSLIAGWPKRQGS
jgi:hypothetical protein